MQETKSQQEQVAEVTPRSARLLYALHRSTLCCRRTMIRELQTGTSCMNHTRLPSDASPGHQRVGIPGIEPHIVLVTSKQYAVNTARRSREDRDTHFRSSVYE